MKPLLDKYQVTIQCEFSKEIYCDPRWFEEALENIIKNCVEQEECSQVMISCKESLMETYLYIQDNGSGFSKDDLPHIFERFYHNVHKKESIGIGLSVSQAIIHQHHGTISAKNHHGALFTIALPKKITKSKYSVTKM